MIFLRLAPSEYGGKRRLWSDPKPKATGSDGSPCAAMAVAEGDGGYSFDFVWRKTDGRDATIRFLIIFLTQRWRQPKEYTEKAPSLTLQSLIRAPSLTLLSLIQKTSANAYVFLRRNYSYPPYISSCSPVSIPYTRICISLYTIKIIYCDR